MCFVWIVAIYERRQAIVPDFEALHQQRRLFVEARLAAAAAAAGQSDENCDPIGSGGSGSGPGLMHQSQQLEHSLHDGNSPLDTDAHYGNLFDTNTTNDSALRQIYMNRNLDGTDGGRLSGVSNSGFIPGDTQHYARAAASRGYVVPGGPGGLLRHRQHPVVSNQATNGISGRNYEGMGGIGSTLVRSLIADSREVSSGVINVGNDHSMSRHNRDDSDDDLVNPDGVILDHEDDVEDEDEDDDDDMEDV